MHALFVVLDAGGNVPPALAIARALLRRGTAVTVLAPPALEPRILAAGLQFARFRSGRFYDPRQQRSTLGGLRDFLSAAGDRGTGADALAVAQEVGAGVVVMDFLLTGAMAAVGRSDVPLVSLVHTPDRYASAMPRSLVGVLLRLRGLDLARVQSAADLRLVLSRPDLDRIGTAPERSRQTGVVWEGHPQPSVSGEPARILVSLSTTAFPRQERTLQTVLDALAELPVEVVATTGPTMDPATFSAPANAAVHRWLDHGVVLPTASLVVGHGGWSTTTRALSYGVPVLVIPSHPMLDQPLVGRALADSGVGDVLPRGSSAETIAATVRRLLASEPVRAAATRLGEDIRRRDGAEVAADLVEMACRPVDRSEG
ncbi:glycosyltransferase [uncultured Friedmanniella sp.]|uniref:glycosyltransferase n=1 Tax=uncultured Friedmanniella sp. TaxID=335381 RepID=UPI0035CC5ACF